MSDSESSVLTAEGMAGASTVRGSGRFVVLLSLGMLVFFLGGYWTGLPHEFRLWVKIGLPLLFLIANVVLRRADGFLEWRQVTFSFFVASIAFLVSYWASGPLMGVFGFSSDSVAGLALAKLCDALPIVVIILLGVRLGGSGPESLFIRRGRVRVWLAVGLLSFGAFAGLFLLQVKQQGIGADRLLALLPWTLVFVFSNAFMEELHFRGLLLKPFGRLLGDRMANLCITLFFTLTHAPVKYTPDILVFLGLLFVLSLVWGQIIQRTGALWGAVLFHAGADLLVILGIYESFGVAF